MEMLDERSMILLWNWNREVYDKIKNAPNQRALELALIEAKYSLGTKKLFDGTRRDYPLCHTIKQAREWIRENTED
jgi:hypothetical protein